MAQPNPFRTRHSEAAARDLNVFTQTFGLEMFNAVPPPPYDDLLIIRSAPGAGKTSLMRALTADTLTHIIDNKSRRSNIYSYLRDLGVLDDRGPRVLGLLINLDRDYLDLEDFGVADSVSNKLLLRLIDARIAVEMVRSCLLLAGLPADSAPQRVRLESRTPAGELALNRIGGGSGAEILTYAQAAEDEILDLFDQLLSSDVRIPRGHTDLYSLRALSNCSILVDDNELDAAPLVMFDDGHALSLNQREHVLGKIRSRELAVGRWFAIRSTALSDTELLAAGLPGRDHTVVELEALTRERSSSSQSMQRAVGQSLTPSKYNRMLLDIADRRSIGTLNRIVSDERNLLDLLSFEPEDLIEGREGDLIDELRRRIFARAAGEPRYAEWLAIASAWQGYEAVTRLSELSVLIQRDRDRSQGDLLADFIPLTATDLHQRGSSSLREAATLRTCQEFDIPYYVGARNLARMGSANIEQFLEICAGLMSRVLRQDSAGKPISLSARIQHSVALEASDAYWRRLSQYPFGDLIQNFVNHVGMIHREESAKPRLPYPPGITGTALTMSDRERLIRPSTRAAVVGGEELFHALASAIAYNVVWADLDYSSKNRPTMVIYLNRLLCPRYGMPLGLGGFRERKLVDMAGWFANTGAQPDTQQSMF